ncbi:lysosomal proton-coupled steroid conjugate and bile acid symporter SLC46A3-like [Heterodontus francisci]|uniref:lysosomal proton-coupled steroid conjugate and bile acid symporter SLC46A3-like n=1 Tax=Heterodontus francisci TaxID=7792 RepID=UPI00355BE486
MARLFLVEPVVALYTLPNIVVYLIIQQYIYRRIWERETNSSYIDNDNSSQCFQNHSNPVYMKQQVVQEISSHFFMYLTLIQFIPSLIATFILGAYSDHYGRRLSLLLPTIGALITSLAILAVTYFSWPIYVIFIPMTFSACFGGFTTLFGGAFAYVADVSSSKQKNMRMALLDMIVGIMGGIGALSSGYFLRAVGFNWPILTISLINFANVVYIIFFLEESVQRSRNEQDQESGCDKFREILSGILTLYTNSNFRKRVHLSMLLLAFSIFGLVNFGAAGLFTLYELNTPLCWNEILIGYGSAAGLVTFLTSFLGVTLFSHYLQDPFIVLIGILSFVGGMIMAVFANTTLLMFLVRLVSLFAAVPFPVLRSMMSKSVSPKDQGALFACVACLENLSGTISSTIFNSVYAATVNQFTGFSFLLAACLCLIPFCILCFLLWWKPQEEDYAGLIINEECS